MLFQQRIFLKLEDKTFPRNLKGIAKGHDISGFGIAQYSVRSEIGRMIAFRDQTYYFPGYQMICASFTHKEFAHQNYTRVPSYLFVTMIMMVMRSLI